MPTLKAYKNDPGYYILAWAPEVGNLTYQVNTEAESVLAAVGFEDGDELDWGVLNALKVAGLLYTGDEAPSIDLDSVDAFDPNDPLERLSEPDAEELLTELEALARVGPGQTDEIRSLLGLADTETAVIEAVAPGEVEATLEAELDARVEALIADDEHHSNLLGGMMETTFHAITSEDGEINLSTTVEGSDSRIPFFVEFVANEERGVHTVEIDTDTKMDWEMRAETYRMLADLLPVVESTLGEGGLSAADADRDVSIEYGYI